MTTLSIRLLLTSFIVVASTNVQAAPETWADVNVSLDLTIDSLNTMRRFAKACSLSVTAEQIAREFAVTYSARTNISLTDVIKHVEAKYAVDPGNSGPAQKCEMENVSYWTGSFRDRSRSLFEALEKYQQHR